MVNSSLPLLSASREDGTSQHDMRPRHFEQHAGAQREYIAIVFLFTVEARVGMSDAFRGRVPFYAKRHGHPKRRLRT